MKRQMIIGVIAGSLLAFTGVAFGQGAPATTDTKAPAKEAAPMKKEVKKETTHKKTMHKETKHKETMHKETKHKKTTHKKTNHEKKKSMAPAAHTK